MTYKFPEQINYGLCSLNFKDKPRCNQMSGMFNENIKFCDVCNKSWKFVDNCIYETTRGIRKLEEFEVGSKWAIRNELNAPKLFTILEIRDKIKGHSSTINVENYTQIIVLFDGETRPVSYSYGSIKEDAVLFVKKLDDQEQ